MKPCRQRREQSRYSSLEKEARCRRSEVLGNHRRQAKQSRLELRLYLGRGFQRANNLDC
jgi:hypothetical protein